MRETACYSLSPLASLARCSTRSSSCAPRPLSAGIVPFGDLLWRRKSGRPVGRPPADADLRTMIRRFWTENSLWGEDRISGELRKLGYKVSPRTVAKYRPPHLPRNRGQSWPAFVRNHIHQTWACDFLTTVTLRFQILYCFVIVDLARQSSTSAGCLLRARSMPGNALSKPSRIATTRVRGL
jgi:hypothetical protein